MAAFAGPPVSAWSDSGPVLLAAGACGPADGADLPEIEVVTDDSGSRLQVDGRDFMVFGMNWGYMPIGQNYTYDLWSKPDDIIEAALAKEMPLLQAMGVNAIRHYVGMPPRWVRVHLREVRHLHGDQPHHRPLRPDHRRRVVSRPPTTAIPRCARP